MQPIAPSSAVVALLYSVVLVFVVVLPPSSAVVVLLSLVVLVFVVVLPEHLIDVRRGVRANVKHKEVDQLRRHIVEQRVEGRNRLDQLGIAVAHHFCGVHHVVRVVVIVGANVLWAELEDARADNHRDRMMLGCEGERVAAVARHKAAVRHHSVGANNHLVDTRHDSKDGRVGEQRGRDPGLSL